MLGLLLSAATNATDWTALSQAKLLALRTAGGAGVVPFEFNKTIFMLDGTCSKHADEGVVHQYCENGPKRARSLRARTVTAALRAAAGPAPSAAATAARKGGKCNPFNPKNWYAGTYAEGHIAGSQQISSGGALACCAGAAAAGGGKAQFWTFQGDSKAGTCTYLYDVCDQKADPSCVQHLGNSTTGKIERPLDLNGTKDPCCAFVPQVNPCC